MPLVSILVPTYNRRKFIPQLLRNFEKQTFPHNDMELIIVDDGSEPVDDLIQKSKYHKTGNGTNSRIIYKRLDQRIPLGEKRNLLNDISKGEIIITMDDDDWYSAEYVKTMVRTLNKSNLLICGASKIFTYLSEYKAILRLGPYGENHTCNHLMGYKREYLTNHEYDSELMSGEEIGFTNNFTEPMIQIENSERIFLLMRHGGNTVDLQKLLSPVGLDYQHPEKGLIETAKYKDLIKRGISPVCLMDMKFKDFVKDKDERKFYRDVFG